jgi:hypothetical protein
LVMLAIHFDVLLVFMNSFIVVCSQVSSEREKEARTVIIPLCTACIIEACIT